MLTIDIIAAAMQLIQHRLNRTAMPLALENECTISSHQMLVPAPTKIAANHTRPCRRSCHATTMFRRPITKSAPTTHHEATSKYSTIASVTTAKSKNFTVADDKRRTCEPTAGPE